ITGDVVDGSVQHLADHTAPLGRLAAQHGVYLVTGNHEYYSGAVAWVAEFRRIGLTVLMNQHVVIEHGGARLVLAGVTDYTGGHFDPAHRSDPQGALRGAPDDVN
ncbi:metallophosphoesterase, partial [Paraburkholderia sp. SIMBA_030]|uniref:metallophosphoesterase n=1 Tax=Paraburkholderia sp. SIMBA_030 TaxID=3085773 RepID=UPI0039795085